MGLGFFLFFVFVNGRFGFLLESGCFNGVVKLDRERERFRCVIGIHATLRCL